ncbi:O-methyltransferase [Pseudomonas matsuisoli]|uniref:SAM-dependent methyltransferase n=1 Tax=Pseudomonas matsuisoli TaxID=1515666 RepID=A0A917PTQ3_9PSED|nr:class I SAM-dependent methyltransferase [Pseudomonas matsuisoli]GGJ91394.1 hypothetical protein GCM10009304_16470 [Pseudomonas matsuisoli]
MTTRSLSLDDDLYRYLVDVSLRDSPLLKRLRDETAALPKGNWQIAPEQGQFMSLLIQLTGARHLLEIGTFTGYSALCMAKMLPTNGYLICCDMPGDYHDIARRYWREADVDTRIDLRTGPAIDTLQQLLDAGHEERFDLMFIDADKANYAAYYEMGLRLVRPGGLLLFDNMLWSGRVLEADSTSADTQAIRALNLALKQDERIDLSLLPIGDGLSLCRKR